METPPNCTVSPPFRRSDILGLTLLTLAVLLVHGYHPWAEDGGLYAAGVELRLQPALFPLERAFVTAPTRYSLFAPALASGVRCLHLRLSVVLLLTYLLSAFGTLAAGLRLARQCTNQTFAAWTATALLAAWWTLPIAGTSLLLMDPYVTARSLSTPLTLWAISFALQPWGTHDPRPQGKPPRRPHTAPFLTAACLLTAALFHPLMAAQAALLVGLVRFSRRQRPMLFWALLFLATALLAAAVQTLAPHESTASIAADLSRYYWFLSQWHWYEWAGLLGPLAIFFAVQRYATDWLSSAAHTLLRAALATGLLAIPIAALFARESLATHAVAHLQPLRLFLPLYAIMALLVGVLITRWIQRLPSSVHGPPDRPFGKLLAITLLAALALIMFFVQRSTFPSSVHIEWPSRPNPNPWVQAFLWARANTSPHSLFALDARYVNIAGEDAQCFRALALRSALSDFSKDGGEAANTPALAPAWLHAAQLTAGLSRQSDPERDARLAPFHVDWMLLHADAQTAHTCPYRNAVVKVCRLHN